MRILRRPILNLQPTALSAQVNYGHPLSVGLLGAWPTGGGSKLLDAVGRRDLTLGFPDIVGGVYFQQSELGRVPRFFGGNAAVNARYMNSSDTLLNLAGANKLTLSIWVKPTVVNPGDTGLIGAWSGNGFMLYSAGSATNKGLRFYINGTWLDSYPAVQQFPNTTQFHHFVGTWDGVTQTAKMYLNGKVIASGALAQSAIAMSAPFVNFEVAGYSNNNGVYIGQLAIPAIWNRVLSDAEVLQLYQDPYVMFGPDTDLNIATLPPVTGSLIASPAAQFSGSSTGTVLQNHFITGANSNALASVSTVSVTQNQLLATTNVSSLATASALSILQNSILSGASLSSAATSGTGTVQQTHLLAASTATNLASSSVGLVVQNQLLVATGSSEGNTSVGGVVTQNHSLLTVSITQTANSSNVSLDAGSNILAGSPSSQAANSNTGLVVQTHFLVVANSSETNTASANAVTQNHTLSSSTATNDKTSSALSVTQNHLIVGTNSNSTNLSSSVFVYQTYLLAGSNSTQGNTAQALSISQIHSLVVSNVTQLASTNNVSITAAYQLTGSNSIQNNSSTIYIQYIVYGQFVQTVRPDYFVQISYEDIFARTISSDTFVRTTTNVNFV